MDSNVGFMKAWIAKTKSGELWSMGQLGRKQGMVGFWNKKTITTKEFKIPWRNGNLN